MRFPKAPPRLSSNGLTRRLVAAVEGASPTLPDGRYLHWDQLRWRAAPSGLTPEEHWHAQKFARKSGRLIIPELCGEDGLPFWFCRLDTMDRATHEIDRRDVAKEMLESIGDEAAKREYRIDQLIEEAINSSVLEGAKLTTRAEAKAMIREGRRPSAQGERMVLNNYNAMRRLLEMGGADLSLEGLLEIHSILGEDALDIAGAAGRLRLPSEDVRVEDSVTGTVWFEPPPAATLPERIEKLIAFANENDPKPFLHPLVRAIVLHFWLAYLHPFADGNGRMARALFYWQMLRSGYDFAQYLSISGPIDRSRRAYYLAFAYTETDEGDLTYFILHQLAVLKRATEELSTHLRERSERLKELSAAVAETETLNHRQQAALVYLIRNPQRGLNVAGHAQSHDVTYLTGRKDLQDLEAQGYLRRVRIGRVDKYLITDSFATKLANRR